MRVGGLAPPLVAPTVGPGASSSLTAFQRMSQYRLTNNRLLEVRRSLQDLQRILGPRPLGVGTPAESIALQGVSLAALGMDLVGTKSTLTSTEEVNAAGTSIGDRTPSWESGAGSTAAITLDGTYNGTEDEQLYFRAKMNKKDSPATLPTADSVRIQVRDGTGTIDEIEVGSDAGRTFPATFTLSNGLTMTVEAGILERDDDTDPIDLFANVGSALDRTKPFDGVGDDDAVLEDPYSIVDGSFDVTVDGVTTTIDVFAGDSLDDLLDRINGAGAGVTAAYDDVTERLTFTNTAVGPDAITLDNDTSGALAALKLDGASTSLGSDPEDLQVMADVAAFAGVTSGTITINDVDVAIDPSTQSLQDVLAALSAIDGVTASLTDGKVVVTGAPGEDLVVADTSGLLGVVGVATGTHEAFAGQDAGMSTELARQVAKAFRELAGTIDGFLADQLPGARVTSSVTRIRSALETVFSSVFEDDEERIAELGGMRFVFGEGRDRGVTATLGNERKLARLLDEGDKDTITALLGDGDDEPGLLERLDDFTKDNLNGLRDALVGTRVDILA